MGTGAFLLGRSRSRETFELPSASETWLALAYLVPVGSVLVFCSISWCSGTGHPELRTIRAHPRRHRGVSAWLDNEPLGLGSSSEGLVLLGVYVGALRRG